MSDLIYQYGHGYKGSGRGILLGFMQVRVANHRQACGGGGSPFTDLYSHIYADLSIYVRIYAKLKTFITRRGYVRFR